MKSWTALVGLILAAIFPSACAPYTRDLHVLTRKQATHEITSVAEGIRKMHIDPFHATTAANFDKAVAELKSELPDSIDRKQLAWRLSRLAAMVGDGHTHVSLGRLYNTYLAGGSPVFPLAVRYYDASALRVTAIADGTVPDVVRPGDRLRSINGAPVEEIFAELRPYVSADSPLQRDQLIASDLAQFLWYAWGERSHFALTLINEQDELYEVHVPAGPPARRPSRPFAYTFHEEDRICYLEAQSFWFDLHAQFAALLDEMFAEMERRNTQTLIVDVSLNSGGSSGLGDELLRRIADSPYASGRKVWRYTQTYRKNLLRLGLWQRKLPAGLMLHHLLRVENYFPAGSRAPAPHEFSGEIATLESTQIVPYESGWRGNLVVVIGQQTASAAVTFASRVTDNGLGLVAGEETGAPATFYCESGPILLPYSGIIVSASTAICFRPSGVHDGRGVLPDISLDLSPLNESARVRAIVDAIQSAQGFGKRNALADRRLRALQ